MQQNIIYEDNHILVVEKPINIPVQADSSGDLDLLNILKKYLKNKYQKPGNVYLGLVHRLDRPVGGVMVFAKTSKAAARLSEQVRTHQLGKKYLALVHGIPEPREGTLTDWLLKDRNSNLVSVVKSNTPEAKEAILDYKVISERNGLSLVEVNLHTGRSHQIRVQLAHFGHPLYGDQKYGRDFKETGIQLALWSYELTLEHPTTKERLTFKSDPHWERYNL